MKFLKVAFGVTGLSLLVVAGATLGACGDDAPVDPGDGGGNDVTNGNDGGNDGTVNNDGAPPGDGGSDGALNHNPTPGDGGACVAQAPTVPPLKIVPVSAQGSGSFAPYAIQPPGSTDWYLVEQAGRIKIIRNGAILATPFLDISKGMGTNAGERGLLSVAFHPNFAKNGRFFTMGTPADNNDGSYAPTNADAVVEWKRDPNNPDIAVATKVQDIVVLPASDTNHNGGTIKFGPDNYLYVGTGDGGGGCESSKPGQVQDTTKLFGKVLRLDVDLPAPFAAPGNPFADDKRVYHYGLRNPFRYNFDSVTFDMIIGDVGQDSYEELDLSPFGAAGKNFGWPAYEGNTQGTCGNKPLGGPSPYFPPIVSVDRKANSSSPFKDYKSVIGGVTYRGKAIPSLYGVILFADFSGAEMAAIRYCNGTLYGPTVIQNADVTTQGGLSAISSIVEGNDGELYVTWGYGGRLGRLAPQ